MAEIQTIARPYAKAVFMIAKEDPKSIRPWEDFLQGLSFIVQSEASRNFIKRPEIELAKKIEFLEALLKELLKRKLNVKEQNFISYIVGLKRISLIPSIYAEFVDRVLADSEIIKAKMISAYEVTSEQESLFLSALKKRFNKEVLLDVSIDPSLVGGAIIKTGDLVIDGSIKGRLQKMAQSIM